LFLKFQHSVACDICRMSDELKHVLVNNWKYAEYIPIVAHFLLDNYVSIYYVQYDIWSRLLVPSEFDCNNNESCQHGNVFRGICYEFAGPSSLVSVL